MLPLIRKGIASIFNMVAVIGLTQPLDSLYATIAVFFIYSYGMDITVGRCIGMMIAGTKWIGNPTWKQKLVYATSYSTCFALLYVSPYVAVVVAGSQVIAILTTGKTTHGLLANMASAPSVST